jgi:hypothetical protein
MPMFLALRTPAFLPAWVQAVLFENHFAVWIAVLALAAALVLVARSRGDRRLGRAGQVTLGVTLLWIVAARAIDTPAERLYAAHVGLADAVARGDVERILNYFKPTFVADAGPVRIVAGMPTDKARQQIAAALKDYGIKHTMIRQFAITSRNGPTAITHFTALTQADSPLLTTWDVAWEDVAEQDWRIANAALLRIGDHVVAPDEFGR